MKNFTKAAKSFFVLVSLLTSIVLATSQEQTQQVEPAGEWKGTLNAGAVKLDLVLHVSKKDGALSATLDSPDQGATGLAIDSITVTGKSLRFEMKSLGANYEGVFSADGSQIEGQFSQQGQKSASYVQTDR
jgi:opacity protein-like surface antigen